MKMIRLRRPNGTFIEVATDKIMAVEEGAHSSKLYPQAVLYMVDRQRITIGEHHEAVAHKLREA